MYLSIIRAGIFNMFVNPIALQGIGWKYYIVYVAFLVAFLLTTFFFYPETRGHTLEQIAFIFDGEDADLVTSEGKNHILVDRTSA